MSSRPPTFSLLPSTTVEYFVRPAGDDSNDGLTVGTAFASLDRAWMALERDKFMREQIIDITGMTISEANQKVFPTFQTGIDFDLDVGASTPGNFFSRNRVQLRATPALDTAITIDSIAADAVTGLMTLTVLEVVVPGAHVGQFVIGDALAEFGVVVTNTADEIFVAAVPAAIPTGAAGLYTPGASITYGDAGNFFQQALYMFSGGSDLTITGIGFSSTASSKAVALSLYPRLPISLQLCSFEGLAVEQSGYVVMDACYIHDENYAQNGSAVFARGCFWDGITMNIHGDSAFGLGGLTGCVFDLCDPVFSGNFETRMGVTMNNCEVRNALTAGVLARVTGVIQNTRIDDSGDDGILVDRPVYLLLTNVVGTGNGEYGISILNGAQVEDNGVNTITGTTGDIELGTANTITWAGVPATAAAEFVRIF